MPRVSVLLTSYNRPALLDEAIRSVLTQTCQDFELIILEDNSPDPAVGEVIRRYWHHPQIAVVKSCASQQDRAATTRYATMINTGLAMARGAYVTYLTDDDYYLPRRLEVLLSAAAQGHDVVFGSQQIVEADGAGGWREVRVRRVPPEPLRVASCIVDHCSVLHTAAAAARVGGWDDSPEHWPQGDARFWDRLTAAGYEFWPVDEVTDVHRWHALTVGRVGGPY